MLPMQKRHAEKRPRNRLRKMPKKPPKNGPRVPFIFFGTAFSPAHFSYSPVLACVGEPIFLGGPKKLGKNPPAQKKEKSGSPDRKLSGSVSKEKGRSKKIAH